MKEKKHIKAELIVFACAVVFLIIVKVLINIPAVNESIFVAGICRFYNLIATYVFSHLSISFAEIMIAVLILIALLLLAGIISALVKKKNKTALRRTLIVLNTFLIIVFVYTAVTSPLYKRGDMYQALNLDIDVTEDDLYDCALYYMSELNRISAYMERDEDGNVKSVYSTKELLTIVEAEMDNVSYESDYFYKNNSRAKIFLTSPLTNYFSISGMYLSLTGEANVTDKTPSYIFPQLVAHELAHSKGIMRENDANFLSYYCLLISKNYYLNYCGLMRAASITLSALSGTDYYNEVYDLLGDDIKKEYNNAYYFYQNYESFISRLGDKINDSYLKVNGVSEGVKSYSQTQKALCALYLFKWK